MKFLFLKYALNWPRSTGHDVHAYEMAKALAQLGSAVGLATVIPPTESALAVAITTAFSRISRD